MTLEGIKSLLVTADPDIRHYFSMSTADAYSYWEENRRLDFMADDTHAEEAWHFYVHRFTKTEGDSTATTLFQILDGNDAISVKWVTGYDKESGYIHHIFECEG